MEIHHSSFDTLRTNPAKRGTPDKPCRTINGLTTGKVTVMNPLPTGRQAFRNSVTVTQKELKDDQRSLLLPIKASLPAVGRVTLTVRLLFFTY
jgi:hypothetical protein